MKLRVGNTTFAVSYLLLCLASICIILDAFTDFLLCLFAIIIHETGHLIMIKKYSGLPQSIKISLFEISISDNKRHLRTFKQNFLIIFFGPFVNFICFIVCFLLYLFCSEFFLPFAYANLSVGLFNMLPVLSLDGGQLLYLLLCRALPENKAETIVDTVTFIVIFPLSALGFMVLLNSKYNFSLLLICVYIVLSLVMKNNRYY